MKREKYLEESIVYFKARPVYEKLFRKVRDKYSGLGRLGGKVTLTGLTPEEKKQLEGFFQKDYTDNRSVTISMALMEKALADSRFSGIGWEDILAAYFGEKLTVRKELERQQEEARKAYFAEIMSRYGKEPGKFWLQKVLSGHTEGYQMLLQQYRENSERLRITLQYLLQTIPELPVFKFGEADIKRELLAVFAARMTQNPHFYDEGTLGDRMLAAFLKDFFGEDNITGSIRAEQKSSLYYRAGILKDDLSNDTLVYGIHAIGSDGKCHEGIEGFLRCREPMRLTLLTVGNLRDVWTKKEPYVYVVENPAVFSVLVRTHPECTAICGNGQPRLATLALMDLLQKNCMFYYAGDFDPEGLLIAQRLKQRYGRKLELWNYRVDWYEEYLSEVELNDMRIRKLEQIEMKELEELKKAMCRERRAVYQEAMMEKLIE